MSRQLKFYNTLTRNKDVFAPRDASSVRMYVCGPTVYDEAHIGNGRPAIVFDVVFRLLRQVFGAENVVYARNITDVDDKIISRAKRDFPSEPLNHAIRKVTEQTEQQYRIDVTALGCLPPTSEPRATEHIETMKQLIERLVARGVAYVAEQHVLFSPTAMNALAGAPPYGSLSRRSLDEMIAGARVDVAPYKRDSMDFVLWKPSSVEEPGWASPCGISSAGRPGWHIECSAMAMKALLEPFGGGMFCDDPESNVFDIHGGGIDLVFPHHENEIAQSCCALGAPRMADVWMHNGFLQVEGEKMSKSLGNFITIGDLLASDRFGGRAWTGPAIRFAMLRTHYRQPIDWTVRALQESERILDRFAKAASRAKAASASPSPAMLEALSDDLNTPMAIAHLHRLAEQTESAEAAQQLKADAGLIGFDLEQIFSRNAEPAIDAPLRDEIERLVSQRLEARQAKNWSESDRLRLELSALGVSLKDSKDGTTWEMAR